MPAKRPPQTDPFAARGALLAAAAEEVLPLPWGSAVRTPSLGRWWPLNAVRVERRAPELTAAALVATARRLQVPGVEIWDAPTARRLLAGLEAAGLNEQSSRLMTHDGAAIAHSARVEPCGPEVFDILRRTWFEEERWGDEAVFLEDLAAARRMREANGWDAVCIREAGRPVAMATRVGTMLEDVYTLPDHRGRGLGAAVVGAAVRAGATFLPTDAGGRAVPFYERLGFATAGVVTVFRAAQPGADASSPAVRNRPPA